MVKAFGTPTYYSRNNHVVVESRSYDFDMVKSTIDVMQSELSVVVDTSAITRNNFEMEFVRAENTAATAYQQAKEAIEEAEFVL